MYAKGSTIGAGPKSRHFDKLDQITEDGSYTCGDVIPISRFHSQLTLHCHDPVESMYYCIGSTQANRSWGGRVLTKDVCCLCYSGINLAPHDEVLKHQKHAVQNPLPVCHDCLALNIKIPGGGTNFAKKREQAKAAKAALVEKAVASGRKKS